MKDHQDSIPSATKATVHPEDPLVSAELHPPVERNPKTSFRDAASKPSTAQIICSADLQKGSFQFTGKNDPGCDRTMDESMSRK